MLKITLTNKITVRMRSATTKGFARTASLLTGRIRRASEARGFAESRLLTRWTEIVGEEIAATARPVEVSYSRGGMGAVLTVLTTGPMAPILEMQKEQIRAKVNGVYGYNAISRIRITQTARTGFAEGQVEFTPAKTSTAPHLPAEAKAAATLHAAPIEDDRLRVALERLGAHIIAKDKSRT